MNVNVPIEDPPTRKPVKVKLAGTERSYTPRCETGCKDCFFRGKKVGGRGPIDSPFVIVGESPGFQELIGGVPFIGPSGDLLEQVLQEFNVAQLVDPYFTNAFKCLPRVKDQTTLPQAAARCHDHLIEELRTHPRIVILALGAPALWSLTGDYSLKITKVRGKVFESPLASRGIVASVHPAFLLRGGGNIKQFREDVGLALERFRGIDRLPTWATRYITLTRPSQVRALAKLLNSLTTDDVIGADDETSGFSFFSDRILSSGFSFRPGFVYIVPGELTIPELYTSPAKYVWHNGKFDVKFHWVKGEPARVDEDTMLMSYTLNEKRGFHDLEQVAGDKLGHPNWKGMLEKYLPKKNVSYEVIPPPILHKYQALDINSTRQLYYHFAPKLEEAPESLQLYRDVLIPASHFLAKVETRGITLDTEWVQKNATYLGEQCIRLEGEINKVSREVMGADVNVRSPKQLQELLYTRLKLGPLQSTDEDHLKKLPRHPVVTNLMSYRTVHKQRSTYVTPLLELMEPDGRIHSTYLLHGTATGRLSSRNPNLQNIPRDPLIRGQFVAGDGKVFIEPDLSQAELRSLACLSADPGLLAIFCDTDRSLHNEVASDLFGKDFDEEQKMIAKNINFGIVYGITEFGLLDQLENAEPPIKGYSSKDCREWIFGWAARFPVAWAYIQRCRAAVRRSETITTVFGRKKRHGVIARERLKDLENEASNFPHQSIASDIVLTTCTRVDDYILERWGAEICNLVHDSALIRIDEDEEKMRECCTFVMEQFTSTPRMKGLTRVPFKSEAKIGRRWGSAKAAKQMAERKKAEGTPLEWLSNARDFQVGWDPHKDPVPTFI